MVTLWLILAFFCGMYFEQSQKTSLAENIPTPRVYLEQLKTKMNIRREWIVDIYLNAEKIEEDTILNLK